MCVIVLTVETLLKNLKKQKQKKTPLLGLSKLQAFYKELQEFRELAKLRQGNRRFKVSLGFLFKSYPIKKS